jgi:hypothetical protein
MKTKAASQNLVGKKINQNYNSPGENKLLQTDRPLSEKDEVKLAEKSTNKALKHRL